MKLKLFLLAMSLSATLLASAQTSAVQINEVMQSNVDCIMDDINEFPDSWVELYNPTSEAVNIEGYGIGLKNKYSKAYKLPAAVVPAHGFILVYCDKEEDGLHTDFRLDSGKCSIYLMDNSGETIDTLSIKKQPAPNIAYGRESDGSDTWGYQLTPTPGKSNVGGTSEKILPAVVFSKAGGVWKNTQSFELELSLDVDTLDGAYIRYTTDGTEPSLNNGKLYTAPITVNKSMAVRAKAFCEGCVSIPSNVNSYIFLGRDVNIPVISITTDRKYLYDENIGIFATGNGGEGYENFRYDWRRPINLEYFEGEDTPAAINQLCETRVQGGYTRINKVKSMAMYANKRFGEKLFKYELWQKDKPGVTDNKSFILRNGGNDYGGAYVRDGLIQRVIGHNSDAVDWQGYAPAIICINGEYHAYLAIRERSSEDNIYSNYNGLDDIDMFENWEELKAGDWEERNNFDELIKQEHSLDEWSAAINMDSYLDLMAINYWVYNTDFPHNNTVMWRDRTADADGRWRWLVKDCDFGLGIYGWDTASSDFVHFLNNPEHDSPAYVLWERLWANPDFKTAFANRIIAYVGDFMNETTFNKYLDELIEETGGELQKSFDKWEASPWGWSNLNNNINNIRTWLRNRQENIQKVIPESFGLGSRLYVKVNLDMEEEEARKLSIKYAGVPLRSGRFDGYDFIGRDICLEASDDSNITAWDVQMNSGTPQRYEGKAITYHPKRICTLHFTPIFGEVVGIRDVQAEDCAISIEGRNIQASGEIKVYSLQGFLVAKGIDCVEIPTNGTYIIENNGKKVKKIIR